MRRAFVLCALAAGAFGPAFAVAAAETPADGWQRIVTDDGVAAVDMPCAVDAAKSGAQSGRSVMMCETDGMAYAVAIGGLAANGGPMSESFDKNLADAKADPETEQVDLPTIAGHKAFRATGRSTGSVVMAEYVDYREHQSILMMAKEEPDGNLSAADRPAARERAQKFIGSLEVLEK